MWKWNQCDQCVYMLRQCYNKQKTQSLFVYIYIYIYIYIHIYIYVYISVFVCWKCVFLFNIHSETSCFWLLNFCIYIYTSSWVIGYIFIYNYMFTHSICKFSVDLYWIIRNAIIYCKYAWKFSVFKVINIFL